MAAAPPLVLIGGPPAGGKTTIAAPLARALGLPLLEKDTIKEATMDALGAPTVERSKELGFAAMRILWALVDRQLAIGTGAVVEANFDRAMLVAELERLPACRVAMVHCTARTPVILARYRDRAATRHPGHHDAHRVAALISRLERGAHDPPDVPLLPVLRVDTEGAVDGGAVFAWVRAALG